MEQRELKEDVCDYLADIDKKFVILIEKRVFVVVFFKSDLQSDDNLITPPYLNYN